MLGLTLALYSHVAFCVYAGIYLLLEAAYYRDVEGRPAAGRRRGCLPSSSRFPCTGSRCDTRPTSASTTPSTTPARQSTGRCSSGRVYYNVEILAFPHRWFNDYRSLANVWLPALLVMALAPGRSRAGFYACAVVLTQALLRLNTSEVGCDVRSHPAHAAAARRARARGVRAAFRRHAQAGGRARRADRACTLRRRSCRCATCPICARSIRR